MSEDSVNEEQSVSINLGESLDITLVFDFHERLNQLFNSKKPIQLDASEIEKIDGAGLQLLAAFVKSAQELQIEVTWEGVSDCFKTNAELLGLEQQLAY